MDESEQHPDSRNYTAFLTGQRRLTRLPSPLLLSSFLLFPFLNLSHFLLYRALALWLINTHFPQFDFCNQSARIVRAN